MIGIKEIQEMLPHRYPFLLIDRILEMEVNKRIVGIKNVTINEPFFQGHFPGHPIMPGVLLLEAMAQTGSPSQGILREITPRPRSTQLITLKSESNIQSQVSTLSDVGTIHGSSRIARTPFRNGNSWLSRRARTRPSASFRQTVLRV